MTKTSCNTKCFYQRFLLFFIYCSPFPAKLNIQIKTLKSFYSFYAETMSPFPPKRRAFFMPDFALLFPKLNKAHKSPNFILGPVKRFHNRLSVFRQYSLSYTFVEI